MNSMNSMNSMDSFIHYIFGEKFVEDNRIDDPAVTFHVPFPFGNDGYSCSLVLPQPWYNVQAFVLIVVQTIIAAAIGLAVYHLILIPQTKATKLKKLASTTCSTTPMSVYLYGFGIIIPLCFAEPRYLIDYLNIKNQGFKMLTVGLTAQGSLRTLQAMYGFVPPAATKNLKNFLLYFSCILDIAFDPIKQEPKPITFKYMCNQVLKLLKNFIIVTCLLSVLLPCNFCFFHTDLMPYSTNYSLKDMLTWQHLANNYLTACMVSFGLSLSTGGVCIMYNVVFGYETSEVVLNPMFKASSPSDFWGRRWNNSVHIGLKNGCYKPVRQRFKSRFMGVIASFVASGIIHEFANIHIFADEPDIKFQWRNMIFFGWNAILIMMEYVCRKSAMMQNIGKALPPFLITMLVILTALPVAHMFTGDWIKGRHFHHVSHAEAMLICSEL